MYTGKYPLALSAIVLLATNTSNAMLKKSYPKFDELRKLEELTGKKTDEKTLKAFYRGLFEDVVIQDINNKQLYPRALGLKITPHGDLSLERLPTTDAEGEKIAVLLAQLIQNPKSSGALKAVQEFYQTKKNPDPTKNADKFFPEIIVKSKADAHEHYKKLNNSSSVPMGLEAFFDTTTMKIIVLEEMFTLKNCCTLLHEFTHFRECIHGLESGAGYFRTLKKLGLPLTTALELEAEFESINGHPDKRYLLRHYAKKSSPIYYLDENEMRGEIRELFPYFTAPFAYRYILDLLNLENNDPNPNLSDITKKAKELFYKMIESKIKDAKLVIELEKNGTKLPGMGGTDYPAKVFKLKQVLGLNPK